PPTGSGAAPRAPHVIELHITEGIETSAVSVRDYDALRPDLPLDARAAASPELFPKEDDLDSYSYAQGTFRTEAAGTALAERRLEARRASRVSLECVTSFRLAPGSRFTVLDHPRADAPRDLLVISCHIRADEREGKRVFDHQLSCIPADVRHRPTVLPKPKIHGTHAAFVVGEPGREIDVDEHGRVEVEFRWDRRDLHRSGASRR